jgi:putative nucleotidyltransferase with HDIG domain
MTRVENSVAPGGDASGFRGIVEQIHKLPSLPQVVAKILQVAADPHSCAADLKRVIDLDPALSLKVMRLVNSSFYGYAGKIGNLNQAVVLLGFNTIKSIALSASVFEPFKLPLSVSALFNPEAFWRHAVGVGVAARCLAQCCEVGDPESLFFAGLVHDIGKMVMNQYAYEDFTEILGRAADAESPLFEEEMLYFGLTHAHIGRLLAEKWNLPAEAVEAITHHHRPADALVAPKAATLVHLADILVQTKGIGLSGNGAIPTPDPVAESHIRACKADIDEVRENLHAEMERAEAFVSICRGA